MALELSVLGASAGPVDVTWTSDDCLLYALGVGAGQRDPATEAQYTTENTEGCPQQALPTLAIVLAQRDSRLRIDLGDIDRARLVHAEQDLTVHRALPVAGTVRVTAQVAAITDKGSGALIATDYTATDPADGAPVFRSRLTAFLRGAGGFGGPAAPAPGWAAPTRPPELALTAPTRPDQALLYRLSGDRNPLHSDPAFARRAGFPRPVLHGLCTYGITARVLLGAVGGPTGSLALSGRFTRPVFPGEQLRVRAWPAVDESGGYVFQTLNAEGAVVIDRGRLRLDG